ncbi:hypothetical protein NDN08_001960 [Rhodosorus marinus]|uniref:alpha-1,2-Mannosidase n=1 Tax=Rhodosorus marinus TaxID=101924 RepID=A0AAV8UWH5_9RHOD|nr:hypothetical protein NDN08_001960 [Rhodosorus marinus]
MKTRGVVFGLAWLLLGLLSCANETVEVCEAELEDGLTSSRRGAVVNATIHAWDSYKRYAWGLDELKPVSRSGVNTFSGMGITILDSLDTLYMMGLESRFEEAREWVATELSFESVGIVSVFETTIRALGGLLSAYEQTGDEIFLEKAEDLGNRLSVAFEDSAIPKPRCSLSSRTCPKYLETDESLLAEVGTLQMEFHKLSRLSKDKHLRTLGRKTLDYVRRLGSSMQPEHNGVPPSVVRIDDASFTGDRRTFGAPSDSFFEYLPKMWVLMRKRDDFLRDMFRASVRGLADFLIAAPDVGVMVRDQIHGVFLDRMEQFTCYIPGMLILGIDAAESETERREWEILAANITKTCAAFFTHGSRGLAGELLYTRDGKVQVTPGYELRPESVEALFYMWRHTKDPIYRDMAWQIFQSIDTHCRLDVGYSAVAFVKDKYEPRDVMHSFFIAETLKYLFLIFSDDHVLELDSSVLNTEAHPLKVDVDP